MKFRPKFKFPTKYRFELGLFVVTFIVYLVTSRGEGAVYDYHVRLADAILHGRLDYGENISWFELAEYEGKFFTVFPPFPAILLLPVVFFRGLAFYQPYLSIFLGALSSVLCFNVILKLTKKIPVARLISVLYSLGTIVWYHSEVGSGWYLAQIVGLFFSWLGLYFGLCRGRWFLAGLAYSAAYLSRIPQVMGVTFLFLHLLFIHPPAKWKKRLLSGGWISMGLLPGLIGNILYNYLRFGKVGNEAYHLLSKKAAHEPWFVHGYLSYKYIPVHLGEMFFTLPRHVDKFPYWVPSVYAQAVWITTPFFIFILFAPLRDRLTWITVGALLLSAFPSLVHGGNGFTQFGYRHTLDYMPFLMMLCAFGLRGKVKWPAFALLGLSILANLWGVVTLSFLNFSVF